MARASYILHNTHTHTHTHSEYIIRIVLPLQKWLQESVSVLRYKYVVML